MIGNEGILRGTTRVLVTHRRNIIGKADFILVLREGRLVDFGPSNKLMAAGSELSLLIEEISAGEEDDGDDDETGKKDGEDEGEEKKDATTEKESTVNDDDDASPAEAGEKAREAEKRIKDEGVLSGRVKLMAYNRYISAFGYAASALTVFLFLANQVTGYIT